MTNNNNKKNPSELMKDQIQVLNNSLTPEKIPDSTNNKKTPSELMKDQIQVIKNSLTPEKIPDAWWKRLSDQESSHYQRDVIPVYGDVLSPRDRELLRNPHIMIKDGVPYRYTEIDKDQGFAPQKLTSKQITEELLDRAEYERITEIGEVPYWESMGITREEYHIKQKKEHEEYKIKEAEIKASRSQWGIKAKKYHGRAVTAAEIREYMIENENQEQRMQREWEELMDENSSFTEKGAWKLYDRDVHKAMRYGAAAYVFYNYPFVLYSLIALAFIYFWTRVVIFYFQFKKRASQPFRPDYKSRISEARQFELWELDRKRWGYDKEDNKKDKKTK